jgi:NO-binding membrane sensor protein with MHYT domain
MVVSHEPWIVALSVLVAVQGAYVGLKIMLGLPGTAGARRRLLLAGAAVTLAVAIWSMHFVGMLAVRSSVRIDFLVLPTLVSFLVCVLVVGLAVFLASTRPYSKPLLAISALVMGAGIVIMHFTGMMALHSNAMLHHYPAYVVASFLIGVSASGLALYFAFTGTVRLPLAAASTALGLAISGMHYTAMAGMTLDPLICSSGDTAPLTICNAEIVGTALSRDLLAVIVAVVAFASSSAFLLALVPDGVTAGLMTSVSPAGAGGHEIGSARAFLGATTSGEADGARHALGSPARTPDRLSTHAAAVLPVQKEGATHYLPVGRVHAVKAEAHYTTVFDGTEKFFCALSISDVEGRLDHARFLRVHRSHIVAVEHIGSLKRAGDGGVAQLASATPYSLPVSRRKLPELKAILGARTT